MLGWSERKANKWICPRCIVREVDAFFDDPSLRAAAALDSSVLPSRTYVIRMTCARCPVLMPDGPTALALFDRWVRALPTLGTSGSALKRSLIVQLAASGPLPAGVDRAEPRVGSINFGQFDAETLALIHLSWEIEIEGRMRPDARALRWLRSKQTLASATDAGTVGFDLADAEAWLVTP